MKPNDLVKKNKKQELKKKINTKPKHAIGA